MAPGLALESLGRLERGSTVLDPMTGSGTVIREATDLGHEAYGFDVDPLAVLMSSVWTTPVSDEQIACTYAELMARASGHVSWRALPWVAQDIETQAFIAYWFNEPQLGGLMRLSAALASMLAETDNEDRRAAIDVLRLNLSRIIVTKEQAASLARDTSHSRPHKTSDNSNYDVLAGYDRSLNMVRRRLAEAPPTKRGLVRMGDVRGLSEVCSASVDAVVTSPPYLNAIDYLRGHRMALVWLGWTIPELRAIRSESIGAEKGLASTLLLPDESAIVLSMTGQQTLQPRHRNMVHRYARDLWGMLTEIVRVLKDTGHATFVVGNSCLKGAFIKNADGVATAAERLGMREIARTDRALPASSRYLPITGTLLEKRMRTETVMTFALS